MRRFVLVFALISSAVASSSAQTPLATLNLGDIFGTTVLGTVQVEVRPVDADGDPQTIELLGKDPVTSRYRVVALRGDWCRGDWFDPAEGLASVTVGRVGSRDVLFVIAGPTLTVHALDVPQCGS